MSSKTGVAFCWLTVSPEWPRDGNGTCNAVQIVEDNGTEEGGETLCLLPIDIDRIALQGCAKALGVRHLDTSELDHQ